MTQYVAHILFSLCTVTALAAQPAVGDTSDSSQVQTLLTEGDVFYNQFENRFALDSYFKAYELSPDSYDVLVRLARTANDYGLDLQADSQSKEAERAFNEALSYAVLLEQNFPDTSKTYYLLAAIKNNLATFYNGREKVEFGRDIDSYCTKGLSIDPQNADIYTMYGVFNRELAEMNWIERSLNEALYGDLPKGSRDTALDLLKKAIELDPELHLAQYELALTYISMGLHDEAIPHLENAVALPAQTTKDNRNRALASRMLETLTN